MTYQRRRGKPAVFYPVKIVDDTRGNAKKIHDETNPINARIWIFPQRGAKAEVTGQQTINVVKIGCSADLPGVELRSRVEFDGKVWDVVSPPARHDWTNRHTRHMSMDVRERP